MIINLSKVPDTAYMEPGTYDVYISDVRYDQAKSGNELVIVTFKNNVNEIAIERFVNTPMALWKMKKLARAVGCTNFSAFDTESLPGKKLTIQTAKESGNDDKLYTRVVAMWPLKGKKEEAVAIPGNDANDPW